MRPLFHPSLVNGRYGDPTVYVETLFEKRSLLFDVGEIASLSPRRIRRIDQSLSRMRISIISLASTICFVCSSGMRNRCSSSVRPALPSASFTSFRPIVGTWSKAMALQSCFRCERTRNDKFHLYHAVPAKEGFRSRAISLSQQPLPAYSAMNRPIACQPRSLNTARPASPLRCRRRHMSTYGRTGCCSAGCPSVRGCTRSRRLSSSVAPTII